MWHYFHSGHWLHGPWHKLHATPQSTLDVHASRLVLFPRRLPDLVTFRNFRMVFFSSLGGLGPSIAVVDRDRRDPPSNPHLSWRLRGDTVASILYRLPCCKFLQTHLSLFCSQHVESCQSDTIRAQYPHLNGSLSTQLISSDLVETLFDNSHTLS